MVMELKMSLKQQPEALVGGNNEMALCLPPLSPGWKPTFYVVAKGKDPSSAGVYSSHNKVQTHNTGVSGACWQKVGSPDEGLEFIKEYMAQKVPADAHVKEWYAVARGQNAESVGVYTSWVGACPEVNGVSETCVKSVKTLEEGWEFIQEYQRAESNHTEQPRPMCWKRSWEE